MKKILVMLSVMLLAYCSIAQSRATVYTIAPASVDTVETIYFSTDKLTKSADVTIQALCSKIGGTPDGTIILEGSLDGKSWETMQSTAGLMYAFPNDTLTISAAAVGMWIIKENPFAYLRLAATGTASDTTLITTKYRVLKN